MTETARVTFSTGCSHLDRASHLRDSADELIGSSHAQLLPLHRGRIPVGLSGEEARLGWISAHSAIRARVEEAPIFLGLFEETPRFAADFSDLNEHDLATSDGVGGEFVELRAIAGQLNPAQASIAATAKSLVDWHKTHLFCSRCGARSEIQNGGWRRTCPACGGTHFPRTDPVVIMLIANDNDVLLGRQSVWPPGLYSLLAGFMEPGETIEDAVRRETKEESGIEVGSVCYIGCQPWPFPSSLMLGCVGKAVSTEITIDPEELEDALWVGRDEMRLILDGKHTRIASPRKYAIARALLTDWVNGDIRVPDILSNRSFLSLGFLR